MNIKILLLLFILNFNNVLAQDIDIKVNNYSKINNSKDLNKVKEIINFSTEITKDNWNKKVKKITFNLLDNNKEIHYFGLSNANPNDCKISIYLNKNLINDKNYLTFTIFHEIGHCYFTKDVFIKQEIDWKIDLTENEKTKINEYIIENTLNVYSNKSLLTIHPFVFLHEIAADVYALDWWYKNGLETEYMYEIVKKRKNDFILNKNTKHVSYWALEDFLSKLEKDEAINLDEIIQNGFVNYLKNKNSV